MTEPRIEKLFLRGVTFKRADVAAEISKYFCDDAVDSSHYIRAGRVLKEGRELGVITKVGSAKYSIIRDVVTYHLTQQERQEVMISYIKNNPGKTGSIICKNLMAINGFTYRQAYNALQSLKRKGLLLKKGVSYNTTYFWNQT